MPCKIRCGVSVLVRPPWMPVVSRQCMSCVICTLVILRVGGFLIYGLAFEVQLILNIQFQRVERCNLLCCRTVSIGFCIPKLFCAILFIDGVALRITLYFELDRKVFEQINKFVTYYLPSLK